MINIFKRDFHDLNINVGVVTQVFAFRLILYLHGHLKYVLKRVDSDMAQFYRRVQVF